MCRTLPFLLVVIPVLVFSAACGGGGDGPKDLSEGQARDIPGFVPTDINTTPPDDVGGEGGEGQFRILLEGSYSLIESPRTAVARDQASWEKLWYEHDPWTWTSEKGWYQDPPRTVNFDTEIVAAVFRGERTSGGYWVRITGLDVADDRASIQWEELAPFTGCIVTGVMTQPFTIIAIPRVSGSVSFSGTVTNYTCPPGP